MKRKEKKKGSRKKEMLKARNFRGGNETKRQRRKITSKGVWYLLSVVL